MWGRAFLQTNIKCKAETIFYLRAWPKPELGNIYPEGTLTVHKQEKSRKSHERKICFSLENNVQNFKIEQLSLPYHEQRKSKYVWPYSYYFKSYIYIDISSFI